MTSLPDPSETVADLRAAADVLFREGMREFPKVMRDAAALLEQLHAAAYVRREHEGNWPTKVVGGAR